jgi:hypothetical protein
MSRPLYLFVRSVINENSVIIEAYHLCQLHTKFFQLPAVKVNYICRGNNHTGQQNLTFFYVPRGKISNPDSTFNAEFKYVSSFSPSPTVFLSQPS